MYHMTSAAYLNAIDHPQYACIHAQSLKSLRKMCALLMFVFKVLIHHSLESQNRNQLRLRNRSETVPPIQISDIAS